MDGPESITYKAQKGVNPMKKLIASILALVCVLGLVSCGSSSGDYEKLKAEKDALIQKNEELEAQITQLEQAAQTQSAFSGQTLKISGGFEATVREKIPSYLGEEMIPEFAIVTKFQDGPIIVDLGPELIEQVEEGKTYFFTIYDKKIQLTDYGSPELLANAVFSAGEYFRIREITTCEPMGLDGEQLEFTIE